MITTALLISLAVCLAASQSNFCVKEFPQLQLADGSQLRAGSCSLTPQGAIPSFDQMVSTLIVEPEDGAELDASKDFVVTIATGFFSDANEQYYTNGQQLNSAGVIQGHQHISIQSISPPSPPDAREFVFFKGLNEQGRRGRGGAVLLSVSVPAGSLSSTGLHRICSITGAFTHQPVIMPVAQRGSQDDCLRVQVVKEIKTADAKEIKTADAKETKEIKTADANAKGQDDSALRTEADAVKARQDAAEEDKLSQYGRVIRMAGHQISKQGDFPTFPSFPL
ncbi:MAG: hypothetical protein SGCHY_003191 [Lobulomycetales sp.]